MLVGYNLVFKSMAITRTGFKLSLKDPLLVLGYFFFSHFWIIFNVFSSHFGVGRVESGAQTNPMVHQSMVITKSGFKLSIKDRLLVLGYFFFHIVEPFSTSFLAILVLVGFFYGSGVLGGSFNGSNGILCPGLTVATGSNFGSLLLCLYLESCCWVRYNLVFVSLLILGVLSGTTFHHLLLLFGFFTLLFGVSRLRWPLEAEVDRRFQPSSTASINPPNRCWNSPTARVHRRDFRSFQSVHVMKEVVIECRWSSTRRC